ncbi:MAG: hypothetical protein E6Q97_14795 [Desulfurellales bacterium]|nr:MAG: hypothetical protein E6Q97_14795 [Desulfurellales bacterium]
MKKVLSILPILLSLGCYTPDLAERTQPLEVNPITDLPSYEGGRVLHPWHFRSLAKDRFPAVATGKAADANCFLADSYYRKCLILQCDENLDCDPGARCVDVALAFDPDGSTEGVTPSGATIWTTPSGTQYQALHLAVCLKK